MIEKWDKNNYLGLNIISQNINIIKKNWLKRGPKTQQISLNLLKWKYVIKRIYLRVSFPLSLDSKLDLVIFYLKKRRYHKLKREYKEHNGGTKPKPLNDKS